MKEKNILLKSLLLSPLGILAICSPALSQPIETLFTTPEQRIFLDDLREEFLINNSETSFDIDQPFYAISSTTEEEESSPGVINYNLGAIIIHSDGKRTILLNDMPLPEQELPDNMSLIESNSRLALQIKTRKKNYLLKPGQNLNTQTGTIIEASGE